MTGYLSKPAGLALLTRRLCSCLIGSHTRNITTIIFEQIVERFLEKLIFSTSMRPRQNNRERRKTTSPTYGLIPASRAMALNSIPLRGWKECQMVRMFDTKRHWLDLNPHPFLKHIVRMTRFPTLPRLGRASRQSDYQFLSVLLEPAIATGIRFTALYPFELQWHF